MADLHDLTALEQAEAVRCREVSPVELVEHCIARIERLDVELAAFVTTTFDTARSQARRAEADVVDGLDLPPLHGVPTAIKDLDSVEGVRTGLGSVAAGFVPTWSDHVVVGLRAAGTISLGKTATPEFGLPCYTETALATTRNPWDLGRSPGGSSGGAGRRGRATAGIRRVGRLRSCW